MSGTSSSNGPTAAELLGLAVAPVARRTGKGHVLSYGEGRVCAAPGCAVKLSRYNATPYCASSHKGDTPLHR